MLKKILFLVILAGIGFGIYTGIHKIVEVVTAPKTVVVTWTLQTDTPITVANESGKTVLPEVSTWTVETTGWFVRTWTNFTSWVSSTRHSLSSKTESIPDLDIASEETWDILTWTLLSGEISTGDISTGAIIDTGEISTGDITIEPTTPIKITTGTTKTVTVVKKTTTKPSTSGKDPLLDALFQ